MITKTDNNDVTLWELPERWRYSMLEDDIRMSIAMDVICAIMNKKDTDEILNMPAYKDEFSKELKEAYNYYSKFDKNSLPLALELIESIVFDGE